MSTKQNFGLVDSSITYNGKDADGFYSTLLLVGDSRTKFRQVPNVKSKVNLASLDMGDFFQADACSLTESGNYTLDQKTLEVCDLGFKIPFCIKDWEALYLSEAMKPGSNVEENYPNGVIDYIFAQIALKGSALLEDITWQGDTDASPADLCDGLQKKLLADGTVVDVAVDGTKLHAKATVLGELERMYVAVPDTMKNNPNLVFFLNKKTISAFKLALIATSPALVNYNQGNFDLNFIGIPIVEAPGLGDYKAVLCDPMNLWYGFDLVSDEKEISFVKDPVNPKTHYAIGSLKVGFNFGVGAEIVYYN